jgi:hypothetical protein
MPAELWILAGPNGSGKTTLTGQVSEPGPEDVLAFPTIGQVSFLNPDAVTLERLRRAGFNGFSAAPEAVQMEMFRASARDVETAISALIEVDGRIGVETVLSTERYRPYVETVIKRGRESDDDLCHRQPLLQLQDRGADVGIDLEGVHFVTHLAGTLDVRVEAGPGGQRFRIGLLRAGDARDHQSHFGIEHREYGREHARPVVRAVMDEQYRVRVFLFALAEPIAHLVRAAITCRNLRSAHQRPSDPGHPDGSQHNDHPRAEPPPCVRTSVGEFVFDGLALFKRIEAMVLNSVDMEKDIHASRFSGDETEPAITHDFLDGPAQHLTSTPA